MVNDLQKETLESLRKMIAETREQLRVFRFEGAGSRRRNVREARNLRKDVARMMTELSARKIAEKIAERKKTK